ncbi:MAG: eukaryotic-like serine/threonine-protein kinase [Verrucomicrobiota bacterium]
MRCTTCDAELEGTTLGGLCPVCLLDAALPGEAFEDAGKFRYDLIEEIARGGMGVVYRAVQHGSERQVAIKMILAEQAATPGMMERFRAEAEAVASLDDPNILPIYEIGECDGRPFYSMKLATGGTLRDCAASFSSPRAAARLIATIARAVHHAHERGILHRDLKPGNVLLDGPTRTPYVSDFGLAKWIGRESRLTLAQSALGTPHYIAPEQAAGNSSKLTPAADVYSLGAILYELLIDQPPFVADTPLETLRLSRETDPRSLRSVKPTVPRDLEIICLKCLAKDPSARYGSAADLAQDLERWLEGQTILARPANVAERAWRWTKRNQALAGLSGALAVALVLIAFALRPHHLSKYEPGVAVASAKSIAVLPFENLSEDAESAYFALGVQDEIVSRLAKIGELKVISRSSTERFASSPKNLREVAQQLGVAHLLQGRVQKIGDSVRVNVQLTNATTNEHVWSETYDRKLTDVFLVETEIAKAVGDKLRARLSGLEQSAIAARRTENPAAHQFYIKGRFFWNKRTAADLNKAIGYLNQAIAADPGYALAYAGLADAYLLSPFFGAGTPEESYPRAKAAAIKAVQLDETLAEAHIAHAEAVRLCDMDLAGADVEFRRGLELDPNYATGHQWYGNGVLTGLGRFDEAIAELKRALELDPLSIIINADLGTAYTFARRYDEAIEQYNKTLEMDPAFYYARWGMAVALELKGALNEAQAQFAKARQLNDDPWVIALQAHAYNAAGDKAEARKLVEHLRELAKNRYVSHWALTTAHLALEEHAEAISALEKCLADKDGAALTFVNVDPYFDPLRGDPRFQALVEKIIPRSIRASSGAHKSIAVLPFVDLSEKKDQEYFCDGISEEIIDSLARIEGLRIVARTSSFSFKGRQTDVREISRKLGVQNILEGSLRKEGGRVRVTAQLINAQTGFHLWSHTYERELQGVFTLQDEMAKAIADALKIQLTASVAERGKTNPEAHDLYLQGLFFSNKSTEEGLRKSLDLFQRSLEKDPNSAAAWTGVAKAWFWLADAYVKPLEAYPKVQEAAVRALALDERNAEAHAYLSDCKRVLDWDLVAEDRELKRALEIDPNSGLTHIFLALTYAARGNQEQSTIHREAALKVDPLSPMISNLAALLLVSFGQFDAAIKEGKRQAEIDPSYVYQFPVLARAYASKGMVNEAIALYQKAKEATGIPQAGLAIVYARIGRISEARQILEQLKELAETKYFSAEDIAEVYIAMGEIDEAFKWLERACAEHSGPLHAISFRPTFGVLRSDPRFAAILKRIGLDPAHRLDLPAQP